MMALGEAKDTIQEFIDWILYDSEYTFAVADPGWADDSGILMRFVGGPEKIMAEFFDIDLRKISDEKDQMLRDIRGIA